MEKNQEQEDEPGKDEGRSASSTSWSSFLLAVDEVPPLASVIETVGAWLTAKGFTGPRALEGVTESDIDASDPPKDLVTRAFLDRKSTRLNSSHSQQSRMPSSA